MEPRIVKTAKRATFAEKAALNADLARNVYTASVNECVTLLTSYMSGLITKEVCITEIRTRLVGYDMKELFVETCAKTSDALYHESLWILPAIKISELDWSAPTDGLVPNAVRTHAEVDAHIEMPGDVPVEQLAQRQHFE